MNRSSRRRAAPFATLLALGLGLASPAPAQFLPGAEYDPAIPTMRDVLGFAPGEKMANHAEVERYLRALAEASDRIVLRQHGTSWEGRALYHLIVGAPKNLLRLPAIQKGLARLADPRGLDDATAKTLLADLPSVAWLGYSVHGDEVSCTDAGLFLAYHLAAAENDQTARTVLANSLVILSPLLNPDGRERFVFHYRQTRGPWPDAEPIAAEHNQPWPGGRSNHYLFDMNRDWIGGTQRETLARIDLYQKWWPQVFVDVHTMGSNSTYYFGPPAKPHNPEITADQHGWLTRYGRNNARWFDRFGIDYFTRETFDAFYPGYGEGWPTFHGSVGMTYEQASVRGLVIRRDDETLLRFRDAVRNHFLASLATVETCATHRREVLASFLEYRRSAIREGETGDVREFVFTAAPDPGRARKLADWLVRQGIEVHRATGPLRSSRTTPLAGGPKAPREFPAGTYLVRLAQPAKRLANVLLARQFDMEAAFLAEQKRRHAKRKGTEFYDLTAWSLPLLYGVPCHVGHAPSEGDVVRYVPAVGTLPPLAKAKLAYLLPSGHNSTAAAHAELQRRGIRVHCASKPFTIGGRDFAAGALVVKVRDNPKTLHATLSAVRQAHRAEVVAIDSSWVDKGIALGSSDTKFLPRPRILMLWDRPVSSYSAGHARYVLEQQYGYPVTIVRARQLAQAELHRFNVLILPAGRYGTELQAAIAPIQAWVRNGGTLVAIGAANAWLSRKEVGLLAAKTEDREKPNAGKPGEKVQSKPPQPEPFDYEKTITPDKERPARTTGAILRIELDPEHWLAFGYRGSCHAVSTSSAVFTPVKLDKGTNVGVYSAREKLLVAGFAFDDKLDQLAQKAWLIGQPLGRGHVVAFTEDPNYRGFTDGLNQLFLNAVLLGPGF